MNMFKTSTLRKLVLCSAIGLATVLSASCGTTSTNAPAPGPQGEQKPVTTVIDAPATPAARAAPAPAPPVALPHDEAILAAATEVLKGAAASVSKSTVVIDPLIDGLTGFQTAATQAIGQRLSDIAKKDFPQFELKTFNDKSVASLPMVLIGTFTPINLLGKPDGVKDIYRVCFAMIDLKSGKIVSKGFARSKMDGVNHTPVSFFKESPVWAADPEVLGYVRTCQGTKAGDPINPAYVDSVLAAALIEEAHQAYVGGNYRDAFALYSTALKNPKGTQSRTQAGLYLSLLKLKRNSEAQKAFGELVDMGIKNKRLAARFGFAPAATAFAKDSNSYDSWIREIGARLNRSGECFEVGGHVSRSGNDALNDRLSEQRAEYVRQRLMAQNKALGAKLKTVGYGAKQNMVGSGANGDADAVDRRIEFKPIACT
jgi:outer membrane protein OmpA-like peptidoglycan-associated protein